MYKRQVLHYDHSKSYEGCIRAIQAGFTSVMFDGSQMEYDQNVECTRRVGEAAHGAGVSVEGEIGTIGETEDYLNGTVRDMVYTSPELARRFVEDTEMCIRDRYDIHAVQDRRSLCT